METMERRPTNGWVAGRIGYSESGVSLLRSGKRQPAVKTMRTLEREFGWPVGDQMAAVESDYAAALNEALAAAYERETEKP